MVEVAAGRAGYNFRHDQASTHPAPHRARCQGAGRLPATVAGPALKQIWRNSHFAGLAQGALLLLLIHLVGTFGYLYIGRPTATWVDSFYMTFITVATIGFGETVDLSNHPMGRLFTVFIAVVGIGTMTYLFSTLVALLVESDFNATLRRKRMQREISKLTGHYIVCGIGRVGSNVAEELLKTRRAPVVIENNRAALDNWLEHHPHSLVLHDDATADDALRAAGVMAAAGVLAVTGDDSHNLMSRSRSSCSTRRRGWWRGCMTSGMPTRPGVPVPTRWFRPTSRVACASPRPWCARMW